MPIALDGIRTCTSEIRANRAADYTMKVGVCVVCVCVTAPHCDRMAFNAWYDGKSGTIFLSAMQVGK